MYWKRAEVGLLLAESWALRRAVVAPTSLTQVELSSGGPAALAAGAQRAVAARASASRPAVLGPGFSA